MGEMSIVETFRTAETFRHCGMKPAKTVQFCSALPDSFRSTKKFRSTPAFRDEGCRTNQQRRGRLASHGR